MAAFEVSTEAGGHLYIPEGSERAKCCSSRNRPFPEAVT